MSSKTYFKHELAELAHVSYSTFYRFLASHREQLARLGVSPKSQTLRGKALDYVCSEYDIDLPDEKPEEPRKHIKFR
ncbi:MAG: hypothetical protein IJ067_09725 [Prevotella sp.]|nr:hypothetical protein [Prevotella sp.]